MDLYSNWKCFPLWSLIILLTLLPIISSQNGVDNNQPSTTSSESSSDLPKPCYESAEDLFRIDRLMNSTFRLTIKEDCLRLPLREIYLLAFDVSLNDDVGYKEIDKLDQSKLDMIRVRRQMIKFGRTELKHFDHNSRFKLAIVFFDRRGEIEIVIQPMEFSFLSETNQSTTTELVLIAFLGILLIITCVLLAILVYINYFGSRQLQSYLIFWRKDSFESRHKLIKTRVSVDDGEMGLGTFEPRSNPIATNDLLAVVAPMLEADIPIKQEYNYAPRSQLFSWNHGKLPENRCKNRYGNLLPYDHTRVTLRKEPITTSSSSTTSSNGMTTDYMNANFIDGYKKVGRYIASQGPINATLDDFWRCVWQYHVQQIVMLTNLEESGKAKCDKYWPEKSQYYGMVKVTLQKTELFADYTIRYFQLKKDNETMQTTQYHFLSWPDHMVPLYACTLISFVNSIRSAPAYKDSDDPMIVHCSAGIGRTGAFIMIDSMLLMAENEKRIDIWAHFCRIRTQRINMVEKYAQYRFVYQVLLEALSHDPTDISCTNFGNYLKQSIRGGSSCSLHKQYEILNTMSKSKLTPDVCKFGLANHQFNRKSDIIPPDYARVILPNLNDYINAVFGNRGIENRMLIL